jgi:uncharacterized protein YbaP (TraB family)
MKRMMLWILTSLLSIAAYSQTSDKNNTLLWKVTGKDLTMPTYLFGTIHMICADDIQISDSLGAAIQKADQVYLELNLDNMSELMSVINKMKMRGDTTLAQLLSPDEYSRVKTFFSVSGKGMIPFSMLERYKPMLAASTLMQGSLNCSSATAMEQLVMKSAKRAGKSIKGLETMAFQMSIFDSIPYSIQAKQLVHYIDNFGKEDNNKEFNELVKSYKDQDLKKLESLTLKEDNGYDKFTEIMLYKRNEDWVNKLKELMPKGSLVVAVGAGHLPGNRGLIDLLRKAGYTVEPVKNDMVRKFEKQM